MENNINKIQVSLTLEITDEDIDDIMSAVMDGNSQVNSWCRMVKVNGEYLGEYASEQISRNGSLYFILWESAISDVVGTLYELTKDKLFKGIRKLVQSHLGDECLEIKNDALHLDIGYVDATVADIIIQYALFNEIIFG